MTLHHSASMFLAMTLRRILKSAEKIIRMVRYHMLACVRELEWTRVHLYLPANDTFVLRSSVLDGVQLRPVEHEQLFERALPFMPGELSPHLNFLKEQRGIFPSTFVVELQKGYFWGHYGGSVFTADGRLVPELSKDVWGSQLHSAFVRTHLPRPTYLPGRTLSLVTPEASVNYHHWMMDLTPRAGLVERAGYRLRDFDRILIKDRGLPFQKETWQRLGISEAQLVRVEDNFHVQAQSLIVPSVRHDNTKVNRSDMEFVRRLHLPEEPAPYAAHRRLYLSRRDAAFRRILNEKELLPLLKQHGFEEVVMSSYTVAEQAKLFSEAEAVIGANGSAFVNLVFAHPTCHVIEFSAPGWVVGYNWMICANFGLPYTAIVGSGPRPAAGTLPLEIKQDIHVNLEHVKLALEGLQPGRVSRTKTYSAP